MIIRSFAATTLIAVLGSGSAAAETVRLGIGGPVILSRPYEAPVRERYIYEAPAYEAPVYEYRERRVPPPHYAAPVPEIEVVSPSAVESTLRGRGFRDLSPLEIDRGYYKLTAIDPAGNFVALSVSLISGDIERARILEARVEEPYAPAPEPAPRIVEAPDEAPARAETARVEPRQEPRAETTAPIEPAPLPRARVANVDPEPEPAAEPARAAPPAPAPKPVETARTEPPASAVAPTPAPQAAPAEPEPAPAVPAKATPTPPAASKPAVPAAKQTAEPQKPVAETPKVAAKTPAAAPTPAATPPKKGVALTDLANPAPAPAETEEKKSDVRVVYPPTVKPAPAEKTAQTDAEGKNPLVVY